MVWRMHDIGRWASRQMAVSSRQDKAKTERLPPATANCLLEYGVSAAFTMIGRGSVTPTVVVIEDEMLAFVADDV